MNLERTGSERTTGMHRRAVARTLGLLLSLNAAACRHAEVPSTTPPPAAVTSSLDGTTWTFCPTAPVTDCLTNYLPGRTEKTCFVQPSLQGRVTFHPKGVAEIVGVDRLPTCNASRWTQSGDRVSFDCGPFTTYDVRLHGDAMTGEWHSAAHPIVQAHTAVVTPVMPMAGAVLPAAHGDACLQRTIERPFTSPVVEGTTWRTCSAASGQPGELVTFQAGGGASFEQVSFGHRKPLACVDARWSQASDRVTFQCGLSSYDLGFVDGGLRMLGKTEQTLRPGVFSTACFERVDPGASP
jgi:hypothetical protein